MQYFQKLIITVLLISAAITINGQSGSFNGFTEDETVLYTMNKQVGQFVKRFNMEEDQFGKVLSTSDKRYHNNKMRRKLLLTDDVSEFQLRPLIRVTDPGQQAENRIMNSGSQD